MALTKPIYPAEFLNDVLYFARLWASDSMVGDDGYAHQQAMRTKYPRRWMAKVTKELGTFLNDDQAERLRRKASQAESRPW